MTKILIDEATVKQVLEVLKINFTLLKKITPYKSQEDLLSDPIDLTNKAINALKALADQPAQQTPEDLGYVPFSQDGKSVFIDGFGVVPLAYPSLGAEQPAQQEPLGYFKAEPFGWTDCAETDEGAVALYTTPQPAPVKKGYTEGIQDAIDLLKICRENSIDWLIDRLGDYKYAAEQSAQQQPVATLWQHGETGRTRITMPGDITDCAARWFKAADLYTTPQPAQRTWVAVSDRLPLESDGEVLVRMRDGRCEIAWATYWHGASNAFSQWTFRDPDEDEAPTHWIHIPAIEAAHKIKENT